MGSLPSALGLEPASHSSADDCWSSPTNAAGCSTDRGGWPRCRWPSSRFWWRASSGATRSWPRSSAAWCSALRRRTDAAESVELTEVAGGLLSLVLWFIFGAGFVLPAFEDLDGRIVLYAVASLTVVRMVPVAIALFGSGQGRMTAAFIGWFGPRGLASAVFALLAVEELGNADPRVEAAVNTIAVTIVFSIVAHGVTARPLASRYVQARRRLHAAGGDDC